MNSSCDTQTIIVFLRTPVAGTTKTRLIPSLGAAGAAALYRRLAEESIAHAAQVRDSSVELHVTPANGVDEIHAWLGSEFSVVPQVEGDLGQKLTAAFRSAFERRPGKVIAIGSDCPDLSSEHLSQSFRLLNSHDVVIGPALDGGYYLIGMNRFLPEAFADIPWSTADTRRLTEVRLSAYSIASLEALSDLDTPDDLSRFPHLSTPSAAPTVEKS